jgi:hypothetical protein
VLIKKRADFMYINVQMYYHRYILLKILLKNFNLNE